MLMCSVCVGRVIYCVVNICSYGHEPKADGYNHSIRVYEPIYTLIYTRASGRVHSRPRWSSGWTSLSYTPAHIRFYQSYTLVHVIFFFLPLISKMYLL